jgi:phosphoribosyl 1,2-cyclic phosphodiesterase
MKLNLHRPAAKGKGLARHRSVEICLPMSQTSTKVTFWGVRGSTPTPHPNTWRYGGNTSCVEVVCANDTRFILDCGTGLRELGNHLGEKSPDHAMDTHVLVTHYHWDHIQGIPFFHPLFQSQNRFHFYGFQSKYLGPDSLRQALQAQLARPYFPVDLTMAAASREYREIAGGGEFDVQGTKISSRCLYHPQGCLGYRLDTPGGSIVYATDNEPGDPECDQNLRELAEGADLLICDAQCSPEQLATTRRGWGHSSWLECVKLARQVKARNLILFHHDPDSSDKIVDGYLYAARQEFASTWAAMEGMTISLHDKKADVAMRQTRVGQRRRFRLAATVTGIGEDGRKFEESANLRDMSVQGAHLSLSHRPALQSELKITIDSSASDNPGGQLPLRGTVVHTEHSSEKSRTGVGVVFMEDEPHGRSRD